MHSAMLDIVVACQDDEGSGSYDCSNYCACGQDFLALGGVVCERAAVAEPALCDENDVKGYDGHGTHCDEERLQLVCAYVGDVAV